MRRHLFILLVLSVLVHGWLMISYPIGGTDDNQAAQHYLVDQVLSGNFLIGNFRYQTGYPLVIAPVFVLARPFGQFDDRIILLVQIALSATIPFMVYDILRRRRSPREALIVALFVLFDPFGLQWAHFYLPEWWIAVILVTGAIITAMVEAPEARIYSWMYPLAPILIGGLVAALLRRRERA